jgi:hypothetical protein
LGIIYLIFVIIISVFSFLECGKHDQPKWWIAVVFLFPPAIAVLFQKTRKGKSNILSIVFIGAFVLVLGVEAYLFSSNKPSPDDILPPIIKEVMMLNDDIKTTTIDIYNATGKLDSVSMVQSRITDVKSSLKNIGHLRELIIENEKAVEKLILFIEEHNDFFRRKNMAWINSIRLFYSDRQVLQNQDSRAKYFASFESLLKYTEKNFKFIMDLKSQQHQQSYNIYYMRYRRAADKYNRFNRKFVSFQNEFVESHPEVSPFLPGSHQAGTFKFWDKFSF